MKHGWHLLHIGSHITAAPDEIVAFIGLCVQVLGHLFIVNHGVRE